MKRSGSNLPRRAARLLRALVLAPVLAYQRFVSPALPRRCKYYPTCSAYAVEAVREVGALRGSVLAGWRVLRCNPFSHGGYDPVEHRPFFRDTVDPTPPREAAEAGASSREDKTASSQADLPVVSGSRAGGS